MPTACSRSSRCSPMWGSTSCSGLQRTASSPLSRRPRPRRRPGHRGLRRTGVPLPDPLQAAREDRRGVVVEGRDVVAVVAARPRWRRCSRCPPAAPGASGLDDVVLGVRNTSSGWSTLPEVGAGGRPQLAELQHGAGGQLRVGELGDARLLDVAGDRRPARGDPGQQRQQLRVQPLGQQRRVHQHEPGDVVPADLGQPHRQRAAHRQARRRRRGRSGGELVEGLARPPSSTRRA